RRGAGALVPLLAVVHVVDAAARDAGHAFLLLPLEPRLVVDDRALTGVGEAVVQTVAGVERATRAAAQGPDLGTDRAAGGAAEVRAVALLARVFDAVTAGLAAAQARLTRRQVRRARVRGGLARREVRRARARRRLARREVALTRRLRRGALGELLA